MSVHRDGPSTPGNARPRVVGGDLGRARRRPAPLRTPALRSTACAEGLFTGAGQATPTSALFRRRGSGSQASISSRWCLRPNGIHAFGSVDRDDRDWPRAARRSDARSRSRGARQPFVEGGVEVARSRFSCLPNSTKVFAPGVQSAPCTPSDISLSSTPAGAQAGCARRRRPPSPRR